MSPDLGTESSEKNRPDGFLEPPSEWAARTLDALKHSDPNEAKRWDPDEAKRWLEDVPDTKDEHGVWKIYLRGLLAIERRAFAEAESLLQEAATVAPNWAGMSERGPSEKAMRLAATVLQKLGWVCRRQDRADEAYEWHLKAYFARDEHGSAEECWESAVSLGFDADVARKHEQAKRWYEIAVGHADAAAEEPLRKKAVALANLASSLIESEQFAEAVEAARSAREAWHAHDRGAVTTAQADMKLGYALLKLGEHQFDAQPKEARTTLAEAIRWLAVARESLEAFGHAHAADIAWNVEQTDFAHRILASLEEA